MIAPLMPKATAVWLIQNTTLTFEQIADFCHLHVAEVTGIADGDVAKGIIGVDPVTMGQLEKDEILRCQNDSTLRLRLLADMQNIISQQKRKSKYTPVAKRNSKPDAVMWLLKNCPELTEAQIVKLIGTTKSTIQSVKNKTHWNSQNIKAKDPVILGLCTQTELNAVYGVVKQKAESSKRSGSDDVPLS